METRKRFYKNLTIIPTSFVNQSTKIVEILANDPEILAINPEIFAINPENVAINPEIFAINPEILAINPENLAINPEILAFLGALSHRARSRMRGEYAGRSARPRPNCLKTRHMHDVVQVGRPPYPAFGSRHKGFAEKVINAASNHF